MHDTAFTNGIYTMLPYRWHIHRVGQNHTYAPYMTVYLVISLPNVPGTHRICIVLHIHNKKRKDYASSESHSPH